MSLDKSIKSGKEHRKPYRKAKAVSSQCRNHGSCEWCQGNRQHKHKKKMIKEDNQRAKTCFDCACFVALGEDGVHICDAEEPRVLTEEYEPTDEWYWCNGTLFESWDEYE